ncbi:MAG: winged helix-turn-helix domain-containing protein, partial [Candidatus Jordarchaeaceae archaeon]
MTDSNIYSLYFIERDSGKCMYYQKFSGVEVDPDRLSGFISAIVSFSEELLPKMGNEWLRTIDRGSFKLLVERGKNVYGLLITEMETPELRMKLKHLVVEFEKRFSEKIIGWQGELGVFDDFRNEVFKIFPAQSILSQYVPEILTKLSKSVEVTPKMSTILKILEENPESNIQEIAEKSGYSVSEVLEEIRSLLIRGLISFKVRVHEDEVYQISPRAWEAFIKGVYELEKIQK